MPADWRRLPLVTTGHVARGEARLWFGTIGKGAPVILLLIDSRGHGRSSFGSVPFHYEAMVDDVIAVMIWLR
jgi:pimeloyl-ACP methyl ester carboxylesterase